ncbi:7-cyano-7-deazaguanine synthase [Paraburkholderia sp. JHI869]|uniref:7-cyano-7-deazaguanine synthase n=1 Tax=Paraburkholderia sp. JHI869 TaxID=3112959 RepID=UPI0031708A1D
MNSSRIERKTIAVLAGGQDSATRFYRAKQHSDNVAGNSFDCAQRPRRGIDVAHAHLILNVGQQLAVSSPQTTHRREFEIYTDFPSVDAFIDHRIELTFVPTRNAFFLPRARDEPSRGARLLHNGDRRVGTQPTDWVISHGQILGETGMQLT